MVDFITNCPVNIVYIDFRLNFEIDISKQHQTNIEEIGQYFMAIEQTIEEALSKYDADKLGMIGKSEIRNIFWIDSVQHTIPNCFPFFLLNNSKIWSCLSLIGIA